MKLAVVTGATGLTGAALVELLLARGYRVRALVRRARAAKVRALEYFVGDLADRSSLQGLCRDAELVFNTAGLVSDWGAAADFHAVNCLGAEAVAEEARLAGVRRFLHVSTVDVFGFARDAVVDETSPRLHEPHPYSKSKREGEERVWELRRAGLAVSVVYPTWIFGPRDRHFIPELSAALKSGQMANLAGGTPHLELTYSENLADACLLVAETERAEGEGYIVGDGFGVNLGQFLVLLAENLGVAPPRQSVPYWLAYGAARAVESSYKLLRPAARPPVTSYAVRTLANGARYDLRKLGALGYRPRVNLDEALRRSLGLSAKDPIELPLTTASANG